MYVYYMWAWGLRRSEEDTTSLGIGIKDWCEPPCGCWEQQLLLKHCHFSDFFLFCFGTGLNFIHKPSISLNSQSFCLILSNDEVTGMCHNTQHFPCVCVVDIICYDILIVLIPSFKSSLFAVLSPNINWPSFVFLVLKIKPRASHILNKQATCHHWAVVLAPRSCWFVTFPQVDESHVHPWSCYITTLTEWRMNKGPSSLLDITNAPECFVV